MQDKLDYEIEDYEVSNKYSDILSEKSRSKKPVFYINNPNIGKLSLNYEAKANFFNTALRIETQYIPNFNLSNPLSENDEIKDIFSKERTTIGKLDLSDRVLVPNTNRLIYDSYSSLAGNQVVGFDFVINAFNAMKIRMNQAKEQNKVILPTNNTKQESNILDMSIAVGYRDPVAGYFTSHLEPIKLAIFKYMSNSTNRTKIKTFIDFVRLYIKILKEDIDFQENYFLSNYILSNKNSLTNTGLFVEIEDVRGNYDDDVYKIQKYYQNSNFKFYKDLAFSYGFKIDKYAPWRLLADISSPQMKSFIYRSNPQFLNEENLTTKKVLSEYFRPIDTDYQFFVLNLVSLYNNYARQNPKEIEFVENKCHILKNKTFSRYQVSSKSLSLKETHELLFSYIDLKNQYTRINFPEGQLNAFKNNAINLLSRNSIEYVLSYVDNKFTFNDHLPGTVSYEKTKQKFKNSRETYSPSQAILDKYHSQIFKPY